eukprot:5370258-Prymnesium_polylepis.2
MGPGQDPRHMPSASRGLNIAFRFKLKALGRYGPPRTTALPYVRAFFSEKLAGPDRGWSPIPMLHA